MGADHDLADFQRSCTSRGGVCAILNAAEPPPGAARPMARPFPMRELGGCERRVATTPFRYALSPSRHVVTAHLAQCSRHVRAERAARSATTVRISAGESAGGVAREGRPLHPP